MDPEQTFLRVHARLSGMLAQLLTPKIRRTLEFASLAVALTLFGLLTVMHVNFVAQPGCASDLSGSDINEAQLVQIKITSHGPWSQKLHNVFENSKVDNHQFPETIQVSELQAEGFNFLAVKSYFSWLVSITGRKKPATLLLRNTDNNNEGPSMKSVKLLEDRGDADNPPVRFPIFNSLKQWSKFVFNLLKGAKRFFVGYTKPWKITRWKLPVGSSEGSNILPLRVLDSAIVKWIERKSKIYEPTYLYTIEKGYLMLPDGAKSRHNVRTVNISISAQNACFGNRMQQLILNAFVGYDTILMNSLLAARGQGYLYNFQTKELYDLNHPKEPIGEKWSFEDYLVSKCGVLIMSLFVFFTTTMSVSFTLRETQSRMLKFTVQLQHHARHRLPTFQLIFVHVIESLVFVPIMIGILFFLFEFYDDQLLAFMVLTFVWLCELFTMISVRTPMSMQYFPRFFLLYFLVFHIYFFSYAYGFSYLAFAATAAFMQHLILYFWNRFEIPALQRFLQQRGQMQALHIGSPAVLTSAFVARFNSPNVVAPNPAREMQTEGINFNSGVAASRLHSAFSEGPRVPTGQRERGFPQGDGAPFYHPLNNSQNRRVADLGIGVPSGDLSSSSAMGFDADSMRVLDSVMMENSDHLNGIRASTEASAPVFRPALQTSASPVSTHNPLTSFSSLLLWILGGPPDGIASLNMFRDSRARRTANTGSSEQQNHVLRRSWWSDLSGLESVRRRYRFSHQSEQR